MEKDRSGTRPESANKTAAYHIAVSEPTLEAHQALLLPAGPLPALMSPAWGVVVKSGHAIEYFQRQQNTIKKKNPHLG